MLLFFFVATRGAMAAPGQEAQVPAPHWYEQLLHVDARVATVGFRLSAANGDLCEASEPLSGMELALLSQFEPRERPVLHKRYGLGTRPVVSVVVAGSPAARAGIKVGDTLVAVDRQPLEQASADGAATSRHAETARELLQQAFARGPAALHVQRNGITTVVTVAPVAGCPVRWIVSPKASFMAGADDEGVVISVGALARAADEDELATIAAHEFAHILLNRLAPRTKALRSRRTREDCADVLGLALMSRAGYDAAAAARFWTRFAARDSPLLLRAPTHRSASSRARRLAALLQPGSQWSPEGTIAALLSSASFDHAC